MASGLKISVPHRAGRRKVALKTQGKVNPRKQGRFTSVKESATTYNPQASSRKLHRVRRQQAGLEFSNQNTGPESDDEWTDSMYTRPLDDREFRLIRIFPAAADEPICCELFVVSLDQEGLDYDALSYTWGDPKVTEPILCNGTDIEVTAHLAIALRAFRYPSEKTRILWADAVCIDQSDLEERSQQVSMMGELYSSATKVLVWLGSAETKDEEAIEIVTMAMQYVTVMYKESFKDENRPKPHTLSEVCSVQQLLTIFAEEGRDRLVPSLRILFTRPYWERIWCVQEIYFAREIEIWIGSHMIPGRIAGVFAWWMLRQRGREFYQLPREVFRWLPFGSSQLSVHSKFFDPRVHTIWPDFLETMASHQRYKATDNRDRIYGLMNLSAMCEKKLTVQIDYKVPYELMIQNLVKGTIEQRSDLGVLTYVNASALGKGFPSWIPRWDLGLARASPHTPVYYGGLRSYQDLSSKFPSRALDTSLVGFGTQGALELPGVSFDHIRQVSDQMKPVAESVVLSYLDADPVAREWFNMLSSHTMKGMAARGMTQWPQDIVYRIATTFTGGATSMLKGGFGTFLEQLHPLTDVGKRYLRDFWAFATRRKDTDDPEYDGREWSLMAAMSCQHNHLFMTNNRYLGVAPHGTQVGDVVVVLDGGYYPFILRKAAGDNDEYQLIGGGFVD